MVGGEDSDFPHSSAGNYNSSRASGIAEKVIKGSTTIWKDRTYGKKAHRWPYVILCNLTVEIPSFLSELSRFAATALPFVEFLLKFWQREVPRITFSGSGKQSFYSTGYM